jgi:hypothetical protein
VPIYWLEYGFLHFLWISDIALFATVYLLWRPSRLLNSMLTLGALPFELFWNLAFWGELLTGYQFGGIAHYMFDEERSLLLRGLSLFHVPLPIIWIWLLWKWGYEPRALKLQIAVLAIVILTTYWLTDPERNINWVFVPREQEWAWMPLPLWVVLYLVLVPLIVYWPAHAMLSRWAPPRRR